jgi:hypothetical protein
MRVQDEQMVWLRAYLAAETEVAARADARLADSIARAGLGALVRAAFILAARQRFLPIWTAAELIQFVAQVRQILADRPDMIDPLVAEQQLRRALGGQPVDSADTDANAQAQLILLDALVTAMDFDEATVVDLLNQARDVANRFLSEAV